ncbi:hypothetical protein PULV_a1384 [Pseudoalteromonas ulvae UL12]|uniref:Antibiotic biosynthesis monooxygenase n=1 Tax=Pseudoalteromonas ulvae TaxID=107327 RepID=A0A244CM52_PSEDV|nr:antibiotic biosynthesis monooxygenase [Pseudoalteromonas ulvae]MBE0363872.1 hypothetical protein [Pseudoalteromonas ulvae UL12]OUL56665.1 antibiotic biosynthesis monooxygenase [Pseudoalteromonas ulvae]
MFVVIFRAKPGQQDQQYTEMVAKMRELAFEKYACLDFVAATEGEQEIAISYWPDEASILAWKNDPSHALAQSMGQNKWYQSYRVEVLELKREYTFESTSKVAG